MHIISIIHRVKQEIGIVPKRSYSINELDKKLRTVIKKRNGFFIEVGAYDGIKQSNTMFFEKYYGWRGLLIEAIPELAKKCFYNRPRSIVENYALVSEYYPKKTIEIHYCGLMSIIKNSEIDQISHIEAGKKYILPDEADYLITVPAITLSKLLNKHKIGKIDLLSIDVEGYESEVLNGIDLDKHKPAYILIEVRNEQNIYKILGNYYKQYKVLHDNGDYKDILYKRRV